MLVAGMLSNEELLTFSMMPHYIYYMRLIIWLGLNVYIVVASWNVVYKFLIEAMETQFGLMVLHTGISVITFSRKYLNEVLNFTAVTLLDI